MELVERLARLFRGLARAHGTYSINKAKRVPGKKVEGKALTVRKEVTLELWQRHIEGLQGLGIVPVTDAATCYFGAIDIDKYDIKMEEIEARCAVHKLPLVPTRTKSGGMHLYCFAPDSVPASLMKARLEEWSVALGFGGCEVFPKQNALASERDTGNWINMPYFGALTESGSDRYGIFKGERLTLEQYCDRADKLSINETALESLELAEDEGFADGPPCLQSMSRAGFPSGVRNNSAFAIGVYLKKRWPDDWKDRLVEYNAQYIVPSLPSGELNTISKSLSKKEYQYKCNDTPCKLYCNRNLCRTREFGVGKGSDDWGIVIDTDAQRIMTDPPYWIISVNGVRIQVFSDDLLNQRSFMNLCVQKLGFMPPPLPPDKWRAEVNRVLQGATDIEAPADSGPGGELWYHLQQYCTVTPQAESREEILTGKPFTDDGWTYFRSADFKKYLDMQHYRALTGTKLFASLRDAGLKHQQLWCGAVNIQVWVIKAFNDALSKVEVPINDIAKGEM